MQHLDHSPTGRVLESFAPARGDMHSPRASVKYTPCNVGTTGAPMYNTVCDYTSRMHFYVTIHFFVMKCIFSVPFPCIYLVYTFLDQYSN